MGSKKIDTKWVRLDMGAPLDRQVEQWGKAIRQGELVAFPTETVYGLGANGLDAQAAKKIYRAKGRPSDNPLILHVSGMDMVSPLVERMTPLEKKLMECFWPGPLTLVFPASSNIPSMITGGGSTVAIRCPDNPVAQALILAAGVPIAAPSANLSGRPSPCSASAVMHDMDGRIAAVLDGGSCRIGLESTVVACGSDGIVIYRPGAVTTEMLGAFAPVKLDDALVSGEGIPKAPGMKYRHYAPQVPVHVCIGENTALESYFSALYQEGVGFLISEETAQHLPNEENVLVWGKRRDVERLASCLYESLLDLETKSIREIFVEGVTESGMGLAVMNRLKKAAGYDIREVDR